MGRWLTVLLLVVMVMMGTNLIGPSLPVGHSGLHGGDFSAPLLAIGRQRVRVMLCRCRVLVGRSVRVVSWVCLHCRSSRALIIIHLMLLIFVAHNLLLLLWLCKATVFACGGGGGSPDIDDGLINRC